RWRQKEFSGIRFAHPFARGGSAAAVHLAVDMRWNCSRDRDLHPSRRLPFHVAAPLHCDLAYLKRRTTVRTNGQLTGQSVAMHDLRMEIERIARSEAKVLVTGESGVG